MSSRGLMERDIVDFFEIDGQNKIEFVFRMVVTSDFDNIVHGGDSLIEDMSVKRYYPQA